ncbi:FecR family protein [uncultured Pontibacter sp.]|uniref:FecR family protein n=1 Tax=uncultured Pontibacter sp. TaxID=453356 RepID=UPI00262F5DD8|nr:FecR domain-containing protein [uncultured Pontibacter sp.]
MNHATATAAELAVDHEFIRWVKYPTHESNVYWNKFADAHPYKVKELAEARQLVLLLSQEEADQEAYDHDVHQVWEHLQQTLRQDNKGNSDGGKMISMWHSVPKAWLSVAAASLLVLAGVFTFYSLQRDQPLTYATTFGEKRTIQLPDNSVVVLNANSSITIPSKWSSNSPREVILQGEAYFSVTHQPNSQRFVVTTSKGTAIHVLGTEFNVYDRGHEDRVVLASGKVNLSLFQDGNKQQIEMEPGDLVSITTGAGVSRRRVDPALYTAWQHNKIYFDDYTLKEVAEMLEQQYGYRVQFSSQELSEQKITAFLEVKNADDILSTLKETFEVQITQKEKTLYISSL